MTRDEIKFCNVYKRHKTWKLHEMKKHGIHEAQNSYFCYMKKHIIQSNDHKKYVKLSHMFKRIIDNEYPICILDISNY